MDIAALFLPLVLLDAKNVALSFLAVPFFFDLYGRRFELFLMDLDGSCCFVSSVQFGSWMRISCFLFLVSDLLDANLLAFVDFF